MKSELKTLETQIRTLFCTFSVICLVIYLIVTYVSYSVTMTFELFLTLTVPIYHSLMHNHLFHL